MLLISNFNIWIFLLIIEQGLAVSYNLPKFYSNSTWNSNATTIANISTIGSYPYDIFISTNNTIYVPNQDNGQIIVWSEGNITSTTNISCNLVNSSSIFVTTTGDIYVDTFRSIGGVGKIISNSTVSISLMNMCQQCWDIFIDMNNNLYCSLSERHQIVAKLLGNDFNRLTIVGGTGSAGSHSIMLHNPRGIFVDTDFDLYVADCGNNRIQRFLSGKLTATTIAGNGSLNPTIALNCPTDIILDVDKYLFIVDSGNHRIIRSESNGFQCLFGCFGSSGSASDQLLNPWALSFDSYGNIFVTDQGNSRIQNFSLMIKSCDTIINASSIVPITQTGDPIVGICNTIAGGSTGGAGSNYDSSENPPNAIDCSTNTKYINFGNPSANCTGSSASGIDTGFYVTPSSSCFSVAVSILFATAFDAPNRDPITITLEGTNATSTAALNSGSSWTLIYSGPTGINSTTDPGRSTYVPQQFFSNTKAYRSYRLLVTSKRGSDNSVQYSEARIMGYI